MNKHNDTVNHQSIFLLNLSKALSLIVGLIGCAVIIGWIFNIPSFKSVHPDFIAMKANTALGFILTSLSLLLQTPNSHINFTRIFLGKLLAAGVFLIGILTFAEYLLTVDLHIDQLIFQQAEIQKYHPQGRMAPITCLVFTITGLALLLIHVRHTLYLVQTCAFLIFMFGLFVMIGYTFHINTSYKLAPFAYASLHAAINFILISLAIFLQDPKGLASFYLSNNESGKLIRRLSVVVIIIPTIFGYFRLLGEKNQLFDTESGIAILTTSTIFILLLVIIYTSYKLEQSYNRRSELEADLIESEERWKYALENANQGVWDWHVSEKIIYFSHAWKTMLGYQDDEVKNEQFEFETRVHPDDKEKLWQCLKDHFDGKTNEYICEIRFRCKDGSYKWILDRGKVIKRADNGEVLRAIGTHTDITDLKGRIEQQEIVNKQLEFTLDAAKLGSWNLNLSDNTAKRTLLHDQIFGYHTLLPKWTYEMFLEHVHTDDRNNVDQKFKLANNENRVWEFECRIIKHDDKKIHWIWGCGKQYKIGENIHMLGLVQDITKAKAQEMQLRETLSYTRTLIETSLDPLVTINRDGKITDVNIATELITGVPREKLIGSDFSNYFTKPEIARSGYQQVFEKGFVRDYPLTIKNTSGEIREVLYNAVIYKNQSGGIEGTFAAARDVTVLRKAEATAAKVTEALKRSNQALQQFAYIASHDLQEPLRMISSYLQLIEMRYKGKLDKDADEFIAFAIDGAKRLQAMITGLLDFSRIETKGNPFKPIDLNYVLVQTLKNLKLMIEENKAMITYTSLPTVMGDENQLIALFQNLINNAIKYKRGETPIINIAAKRQENEWIISVQDNGIGIDPKDFESIFIIFKRLNDKQKYAGSGIGLAVCKRIVERHNGRIWLDSIPDKGSTFYFTIPAIK